ncbi:hypothetical protein AQUCO_01700007v1 [Aquilegia coerulea]|uniref:Uncharacterized protein n=1 Tax=Aquilegia coerulea TaxID=218851 RepID=A0A2G5DKS8_AQUCA|nr:hypothetical protein AQUCO_01700007v1 [Aquilegia coerulea]
MVKHIVRDKHLTIHGNSNRSNLNKRGIIISISRNSQYHSKNRQHNYMITSTVDIMDTVLFLGTFSWPLVTTKVEEIIQSLMPAVKTSPKQTNRDSLLVEILF